jgi:hypothetical protein
MGEVSGTAGTAVLFENERIRVWELVLGPGEAGPLRVDRSSLERWLVAGGAVGRWRRAMPVR